MSKRGHMPVTDTLIGESGFGENGRSRKDAEGVLVLWRAINYQEMKKRNAYEARAMYVPY